MVLNTSFNENEPVVCAPKEALDCFLRTKMDVLVMGSTVIIRTNEAKCVPSVEFSSSLPHRCSAALTEIGGLVERLAMLT